MGIIQKIIHISYVVLAFTGSRLAEKISAGYFNRGENDQIYKITV